MSMLMDYFSGFKSGDHTIVASQMLNIENVSVEDEGNYFCKVVVNSQPISHAVYTLQVHSMYSNLFLVYCCNVY